MQWETQAEHRACFVRRCQTRRLHALWVLLATAVGAIWALAQPAVAAAPGSVFYNPWGASTSEATRREATRSIPLDKLQPDDRAKVESVLSNPSIFRRLPTKVVDCDPDLYLFLVRHPDVVINIWEIMQVSQLELRQIRDNQFQLTEPQGTVGQFSFVYRSHDTHVLYGEGTYIGPLMGRPVKGRGVLVLKCGYLRETNGRYYITSRVDCFLAIEPGGVELFTKTMSPLMGKTADNNFVQTVSFVSSLSRTAETNSRGVQRLGDPLGARAARGPRPFRGSGRRRGAKIRAGGRRRTSQPRRNFQSLS